MYSLYKYFFLSAGLLALFSLSVIAQDSLFQQKAFRNLQELDSKLNAIEDIVKIEIKTNSDYSLTFKELNLKVFKEELSESENYYSFLLELPENYQRNLIYQFSSIEIFLSNELKDFGLSPELKYLPAALSFLNNDAIGPNHKVGLWQLTHFQALLNGLEVNRFIDERFDTRQSTSAALGILRINTEQFQSEEVAVLSFLAGKTSLQNVLAKLSTTFSVAELLEQMPERVNQKVALFQALAVFLEYNKKEIGLPALEADTVVVNRQMHLQQIARLLDIPLPELEYLNPHLRYDILPAEIKGTNLVLPKGKKEDFTIHFDSIVNFADSSLFDIVSQKIEYPPAPNRQYAGEKVKDLEIEGKTKVTYTIQPGDVLGFIAEDYKVRVADLKYWNNIYNERRIQAGKKLYIFVDDSEAEYYKKLQPEEVTVANNSITRSPIAVPENAKRLEHTVKSGESPYVIAKKYEGVSPEAILDWNGISDPRKIQIGQKLIIYLTQ